MAESTTLQDSQNEATTSLVNGEVEQVVDAKQCERLSEDASNCLSEKGISGRCSLGSVDGDQSCGDRKAIIESTATLLLTRLREERLFELRQLQHGARTVTREDGPKETIANFFHRVHENQSGAEGEDEHRPESVLFEVRHLTNVRPVTSLLQTQAFRRQLESAVRGGISRLAPRLVTPSQRRRTSSPPTTPSLLPAVPSHPPPPPPTPPTNTTPYGEGNGDILDIHEHRAPPLLPPVDGRSSPPPLPPSGYANGSLEPSAPVAAAAAAAAAGRNETESWLQGGRRRRQDQQREHERRNTWNLDDRGNSSATPWLLRRSTDASASAAFTRRSTAETDDEAREGRRYDPISAANDASLSAANDAVYAETEISTSTAREDVVGSFGIEVARLGQMEDLRREEVVFEISSLVHEGVVSRTLQSGFRNTLERQMATRLNQVGPEAGRRVARFITRLPPPSTGISRNDFSSLGISSRHEVDDAMEDADSNFEGSSYIHIQHNNGAVMRELTSLKQQMASLQQMMRLQMEMQADVQRAIRQEVSAAIHAADPRGIGSGGCSVDGGGVGVGVCAGGVVGVVVGGGGSVDGGVVGGSGVVSDAGDGNIANGGATNAVAQERPTGFRPLGEGFCVVCLEQDADAVLLNCGHLSCCMSCGQRLREMDGKCPICRAPIREIIKVYKATAGSL